MTSDLQNYWDQWNPVAGVADLREEYFSEAIDDTRSGLNGTGLLTDWDMPIDELEIRLNRCAAQGGQTSPPAKETR
jgi:hypothetical protein